MRALSSTEKFARFFGFSPHTSAKRIANNNTATPSIQAACRNQRARVARACSGLSSPRNAASPISLKYAPLAVNRYKLNSEKLATTTLPASESTIKGQPPATIERGLAAFARHQTPAHHRPFDPANPPASTACRQNQPPHLESCFALPGPGCG